MCLNVADRSESFVNSVLSFAVSNFLNGFCRNILYYLLPHQTVSRLNKQQFPCKTGSSIQESVSDMLVLKYCLPAFTYARFISQQEFLYALEDKKIMVSNPE